MWASNTVVCVIQSASSTSAVLRVALWSLPADIYFGTQYLLFRTSAASLDK